MTARSPWYRSAPVPLSDQPWFINGIARVATVLGPNKLLKLLHEIEAEFGRTRNEPNAARRIDLDLIAYGNVVCATATLILPHPRMTERGFVLMPLRDIAPEWRHPVSGYSINQLIASLPQKAEVERLSE